MMRKVILALILLAMAGAATAEVRVAATVPNMGMLVEEIGGDAVDVTVMAPPDRDAHYLEATPSMMAALRRADMVVSVGAELEVGWLPAAIQGANNPQVQTGRSGYFEAANHIQMIEVGLAPDRAQGDIHPEGNPHFYMDPERMAQVGHALANRLADFDSDNADTFRENAEDFEAAVEERVPEWQEMAEDAPGVVLFHKDINYLMRLVDVPIHGYLEPLPGIPPTARHLQGLVDGLRDRDGVVMLTDFQPGEGARFVADELGWDVAQYANQVQPGDDRYDYFEMIDQWVEGAAIHRD